MPAFRQSSQGLADAAEYEPSLLDVRDLVVEFPGSRGPVSAVRGISYDIRPSEAVGLVGESGSGKSASVLALLGLLQPNDQIQGQAWFKGRDLLSMDANELRAVRGSEIGFVFQDPLSGLDPTMTVGRQVSEALAIHSGTRGRQARVQAREMLDLVGIPRAERRLDQYPHEFSGGMRQRVMIAAALVTEPSLLIADEPTTALDVTIQAQIVDLLERLRQELSMSVLLITHDLGLVARLTSKVNVMYAGRIVERGTAESILSQSRHPYTKGLLRSVPRIDQEKEELRSIPGSPPDPSSLPTGCAFAVRCPSVMGHCAEQFPPTVGLANNDIVECWLYEASRGA